MENYTFLIDLDACWEHAKKRSCMWYDKDHKQMDVCTHFLMQKFFPVEINVLTELPTKVSCILQNIDKIYLLFPSQKISLNENEIIEAKIYEGPHQYVYRLIS